MLNHGTMCGGQTLALLGKGEEKLGKYSTRKGWGLGWCMTDLSGGLENFWTQKEGYGGVQDVWMGGKTFPREKIGSAKGGTDSN